jgi:antitoxin component YwqK of YwqJK toxin-antitoxin module
MNVRAPVLLVIAAGVVAAVVLMRLRPQPESLALAEVARANLQLRDGRLYQVGRTNPFTGFMVEFYPHHAPLSRSVLSNGLLNGLSEGWYTNGQIQVREYFTNGVSHGFREKWHENGKKMSEANIVEGKIEGTFRRWHDNGQLAEQIEMKQGAPDGAAAAYYPSGCLKARTRAQAGKVIDQKIWNDGEMREPSDRG